VIEKPTYSTTKTALNWSLVLGWVVLLGLTGGSLAGQKLAIEMAWIMAPSMVALIVAILGVHRAFGSMDMRTMMGKPQPRKAKAEGGA
jgi:hypothetical protein